MRRLPLEYRKRAITMYLQGRSIRAIATELGTSYGWVHSALTDAGVQLRPHGGARFKGRTR